VYYIDPHIHMLSRTTDDYEALARMDCVAVSEPAFWPGLDRQNSESFYDYFRHLTEFEPARAAKYGIQHYSWLCVNAKEAENLSLSREVLSFLPEFLNRGNVLGIGEIGLNKNTRNEAIVFMEHKELAIRHDQLILIHTPHLADKLRGTRMILDMLCDDQRIRRERVLVDHAEEHTIRPALDAGFWVGMTLYPTTKCTPQRAADLAERYGTDRLMVNSAGDWGPSRPVAVRDFIFEMRRRRHSESTIRRIVYDNPVQFFSQSPAFQAPIATEDGPA
jgi:predicted metal-dependent TIM-barrel fold hydrolase